MRSRRGHAIQNGTLFLLARVINDDFEHEAIDLSLRKRVGSFLFDGILRGQHEEGLIELEGLLADRDLALLHGLQQG